MYCSNFGTVMIHFMQDMHKNNIFCIKVVHKLVCEICSSYSLCSFYKCSYLPYMYNVLFILFSYFQYLKYSLILLFLYFIYSKFILLTLFLQYTYFKYHLFMGIYLMEQFFILCICARSSMKPFMEPTSACIRTFNVGETNHAKNSYHEKKTSSCMSNPSPKMMQQKQHVSKKAFVTNKLLENGNGDDKCLNVSGPTLEEHLYGSSQKTNSLGQQVNRTQNMST